MQQPGWFPDPGGQPQTERFWDGSAWTTATRPANGPTPGPGGPSGPARKPAKPAIIIAAVLAGLLIIGGVVGVLLLRTGGGETGTVAPVTPAPVTPAAPAPPTAPGAPTVLNCGGGNGPLTRSKQPTYSAAGVTFDGVPDWGFSYDPVYWTWLDDHSSLGAIRLDNGKNEAGITIGSLRHDLGFADLTTAGEQMVKCLEGTLSVEAPATAGAPTTERTELGGLPAWKTTVEYTADSSPEPLQVTIYVIDSGQPGKWAQIITFHRPNSEAIPLIDNAMRTVRRT